MSSNIEIEPGAASESVLVATESFDNLEQMSSSLDEIKNTSAVSQSDELNDNTQNDHTDDGLSSSSNEDSEDQVINKEWTDKKKHVFVLSSAGKPIYSRYFEITFLF